MGVMLILLTKFTNKLYEEISLFYFSVLRDASTSDVANDSYNENDLNASNDDISILDRRNDGASVYYYVKRKTSNDDIYIWELENKLSCSKAKIKKFNLAFQQKQKLKQKIRAEERTSDFGKKKKKFKDRLLPCACIKDSPIDLNRSFRGSICDF